MHRALPQFARVDATHAEGAEQAASECQRVRVLRVLSTPRSRSSIKHQHDSHVGSRWVRWYGSCWFPPKYCTNARFNADVYRAVLQFARVDATHAEGAEQAASENQRVEAKVIIHQGS